MSLLTAIHRAINGSPELEAVLDAALDPEAVASAHAPEASASIVNPAAAAEQKEPAMSDQNQTPAANASTAAQPDQTALANARAEGASAERARIQAIVTHAEADGRGKLAAHLAFSTDMSAEAAGGLLAASPKESAATTVEADAAAYEASRTGAEGLARPAPKGGAREGKSGLSAAVDREIGRMKQ